MIEIKINVKDSLGNTILIGDYVKLYTSTSFKSQRNVFIVKVEFVDFKLYPFASFVPSVVVKLNEEPEKIGYIGVVDWPIEGIPTENTL